MNWRFLCQVSDGVFLRKTAIQWASQDLWASLVGSKEVTKKSRAMQKTVFSVSQLFSVLFFLKSSIFSSIFFPSPHISMCFKSFPWTKARSRMHVPHVALLAPSGSCNLDEKQKWSFNWKLKKRPRLGVRIFPNLRFVFFLIFFGDVFFFVILLHWIGNTEHVSQEQTAVGKERRRLARVAGLGRASVRGPGNPPSFGWVWHWKVKLMSIVGGTYAQL